MADSILDVNDILNEYSVDIQNSITKAAEQVAKSGADKLKSSSPKRTGKYATGKYAKGWRVKTTKSKGEVSSIIHNATDYQLTHLLEHPHLKRNGDLTTPKVHIKPVEESCIKQYETQVENVIKNGG